MNKIVLILIAMLLLSGTIIYIVNPQANSIRSGYPLFFLLAKVMAMIMLLAHGKFYETPYFKIAMAFIGVLILGALFKILHIIRADALLTVGAFGVPSTYFLYFITKETRQVIDYAKLLAVIMTFVPAVLIVLHILDWEVGYIYQMIGNILIWVIFFHFVVTAIKFKDLLKK
jgi:hypothetical protein